MSNKEQNFELTNVQNLILYHAIKKNCIKN